MAWAYNLLNDDTTLQLNDTTNYVVRHDGFSAPPPERRIALGGQSLLRHGGDLLQRVYANRTVTLDLDILGSSQDNLITNINAITDLLERAAEFSKLGLGSQVKMRRQWESATNTADFYVLEGVLDVRETSTLHTIQTRLRATLTLLCEPFVYGTAETIENYLNDPGFEFDSGTPFVDWTVNNGTRSTDSTSPPEGSVWGKVTANASAAQIDITQTQTMVAGNHVFTIKYKINGDQSYEAYISDAGGTTTLALTADDTERTATVTRDSGANTSITVGVRTTGSVTDSDDIILLDKGYLGDGTTAPTAWVSGRAVKNNNEDEGKLQQSKVNFIDMESIPGDLPALLQVKLTEDQSHDTLWAGARHAGRQRDTGLWHEGEDGSATDVGAAVANANKNASVSTADANASSGNYRQSDITQDGGGSNATVTVDTYYRHNWTISNPPTGQYRVLARVAVSKAGSITPSDSTDLEFGLSWGYGAVNLLDDTNPDTGSFQTIAAFDRWVILDFGAITIPPIETPDGQTAANFILKLFEGVNTQITLTSGFSPESAIKWFIDYVILVPIDMGANYVSKTSGTDVVLLDARSKPKGLWLLNTSDVVQSYPANQLGSSPEAHPDGTRIYFLSTDTNEVVITDGWTVAITYLPRYLYVR